MWFRLLIMSYLYAMRTLNDLISRRTPLVVFISFRLSRASKLKGENRKSLNISRCTPKFWYIHVIIFILDNLKAVIKSPTCLTLNPCPMSKAYSWNIWHLTRTTQSVNRSSRLLLECLTCLNRRRWFEHYSKVRRCFTKCRRRPVTIDLVSPFLRSLARVTGQWKIRQKWRRKHRIFSSLGVNASITLLY